MKAILKVKDRIALANILPQRGDLRTMRISKDIKAKVDFSQSEIKKFKIETISGPAGQPVLTWNDDNHKGVKKDFTDLELDLIKERFNELDREKNISQEALDVHEKLIK